MVAVSSVHVLAFGTLLVLALISTSAADIDFSRPGDCDFYTDYATFPLPAELRRLASSLSVTLTLPNCTTPTNAGASNILGLSPTQFKANAAATTHPVLFFYSGFQLRAAYYARLSQRAASYGYIVVQYDLPFLSIKPAVLEVAAFKPFLAWVTTESKKPQSPLYGIVDPSHSFVAGHSRGGKLAALIFADNTDTLQAGFLVDPIDSSSMAPISPDNPSGVQALKASGKPIAVVGAGKLSACNPTEGNYEKFYGGAAASSWEIEIPGASHATFEDGGPVVNAVQDLACGRGSDGREFVAELTATPMLAWFYKESTASLSLLSNAGEDPLTKFYEWIDKEEDQGLITFEEKNSPGMRELVKEEHEKFKASAVLAAAAA